MTLHTMSDLVAAIRGLRPDYAAQITTEHVRRYRRLWGRYEDITPEDLDVLIGVTVAESLGDTLTKRIEAELADCVRCAREQGYDGTDDDYEYTADDLRSVTAALGAQLFGDGDYRPTREQWASAGIRDIGGLHCT